ncbi:MAG: NAD(P)H-binding protein [Bacteriovoracaceae bacterium]
MRIGIAGASGFIGKKLISFLGKEAGLIKAMSRTNKTQKEGVEWVQTDLFSFESSRKALSDVDVAIYLVHSMLPSSRLFQGNFQDTDLLLADNFANACKVNGVKQIIYLGGVLPEKVTSKHLESRREVEDVFKATKIPLTILRAGMVVGNGGSSFEILKNLVMNLPGMILPKWTQNRTQAIFIDDLLNVIKTAIGDERFYDKTFNVVNGEDITYEELIRETAVYFNKKQKMFFVPINYLSLSKFWVKTFGESELSLVSPLIDSLQCHFPRLNPSEEIENLIRYKTFRDMLKNVDKTKTRKKKSYFQEENSVRSIQRLKNQNLDQEGISNEYLEWLPQKMNGLIVAVKKNNHVYFKLRGFGPPLLILERIKDEKNLKRIKFHIVGGLLSKTKNTGWLEFRIVAEGKYTLSSINEFVPSLPWYVYRLTQAPLHAFIMNEFSKYLNEKRETS